MRWANFLSSRRKDRPLVAASVCVEAMEQRLLMAVARAAGGSGYSGTLSTNATLRQQQLICDPDEPLEGSTTVRYDASKVSVEGYEYGPGYGPNIIIGGGDIGAAAGENNGYVAVQTFIFFPNRPPVRRVVLQEINSFLTSPQGPEVGYVQFRYSQNGNDTGQIPVGTSYTEVESGGVSGTDTHAIYFQLKEGVPDTAAITYTIFAAPANLYGNNPADYLVVNDAAHTRFESTDLTPATVSSQSINAYVSGTAWTSSFKSYLGRSLQGSSTLGYRVSDISQDRASAILPWTNLNTISLTFSRPLPAGVGFDAGRVTVLNSSGAAVPVTLSYDAAARIGTISFAASLPAGQLRVEMNLDTFAGIDRTLYLNVLPGDVDRSGGTVVATDLVRVRNRIGQSAPRPPIIITRGYSTLTDVDGSGAINATDLVLVRNRIGILPTVQSRGVAPFSERLIHRPLPRLDELS